jgi:trigger factor
LNITHQLQDEASVLLTINIQPEDYLPGVESEVKKTARKAKMPGFREGKVPAQLVKKMYGPSIFYDVMNKIVQRELDQYVKENNWDLWDSPIPTSTLTDDDVSLDSPKAIQLDFQIGLVSSQPLNFDVKDLKRYEIEIDEEFLNDEIQNLRIRFGKSEAKEAYAEGDSVFGRAAELNADGQLVADGLARSFTLHPSKIEKKDFMKGFDGKKADDFVDFKFSDIFKSPEKGAELLRVSLEDYTENYLPKTFRFTIKSIEHTEIAELNQELFEKVFAQDTPETEADFIEMLRKRLADMSSKWSDSYFNRDAMIELLKINPVTIPADFIKKLMRNNENAKGLSEQELEVEYTRQEPELKKSIIRANCFKQLEIKVDNDGFKDFIRKTAITSFGENVDEAMLDSYVSYVMQNKESSKQMMEQMTEELLNDKLKDTLKAKPTSITASEFRKL